MNDRKKRQIKMTDLLFAAATTLAELKRVDVSDLVGLLVLKAWEAAIEKKGKETMQSLLYATKERLKNEDKRH